MSDFEFLCSYLSGIGRRRPDSKRDRQGLRTRCCAEDNRPCIRTRSETSDSDAYRWIGRGYAARTGVPVDIEPVTTFIRGCLRAPVHLRGACLGDSYIDDLRSWSRLQVGVGKGEAARRYLEQALRRDRQAYIYRLRAILDRACT